MLGSLRKPTEHLYPSRFWESKHPRNHNYFHSSNLSRFSQSVLQSLCHILESTYSYLFPRYHPSLNLWNIFLMCCSQFMPTACSIQSPNATTEDFMLSPVLSSHWQKNTISSILNVSHLRVTVHCLLVSVQHNLSPPHHLTTLGLRCSVSAAVMCSASHGQAWMPLLVRVLSSLLHFSLSFPSLWLHKALPGQLS